MCTRPRLSNDSNVLRDRQSQGCPSGRSASLRPAATELVGTGSGEEGCIDKQSEGCSGSDSRLSESTRVPTSFQDRLKLKTPFVPLALRLWQSTAASGGQTARCLSIWQRHCVCVYACVSQHPSPTSSFNKARGKANTMPARNKHYRTV